MVIGLVDYLVLLMFLVFMDLMVLIDIVKIVVNFLRVAYWVLLIKVDFCSLNEIFEV